jgi:hypothetical protein
MIPGPLPHPVVFLKRILPVFGYDEAPHGHAEVLFDNAGVPLRPCSAKGDFNVVAPNIACRLSTERSRPSAAPG